MLGTCKLCLQTKELIKKSHIIPEFMYQYLIAGNKKFRVINSSELVKANPKSHFKPTGEYEGGILCKGCENKIGAYESYAAKTIYATELPTHIAPKLSDYYNKEGQSFSYCENIDYKKFKLFLLSIIWKASISSRTLFVSIKLGKHEEELRKMIYFDNPRKECDYPIIILTTINDKEFPLDFVIQPQSLKLDGHSCYLFPISGLYILFFVSNHPKNKEVLQHTLRECNSMTIMHIPKGQGWKFMANLLNIRK